MSKNKEIPLYTKIGGRLTIIILFVLTFMLVKNCVISVHYGSKTTEAEVQHYYERGYADGKNTGGAAPVEPDSDNPLLVKSYRKGYRNGWDATKKIITSPAE